MWSDLLTALTSGSPKALARAISLVENEAPGFEQFLSDLPQHASKIIGITGPPGAGKSTLVDGLIREIVNGGHSVAVLCVDPSSPFHLGAVLGDRIRMSEWYTHPKVFIRSLATRGSMGGLHPKIIEIAGLAHAARYDYLIIETVGVGQSEIEIAGLADVTAVVVVPEAGDEVQTMKAGLMEIADLFVVNKADRPDADRFVKNLRLMLSPSFSNHREVPILKTVAATGEGLPELFETINRLLAVGGNNERRAWLLAERAWSIIQRGRMKDLDKAALAEKIRSIPEAEFNLYRFVKEVEKQTMDHGR